MISVVTGAGSGIGRCVAQALACEGYRVVLAGRRFERLEFVANEIARSGGTALPITTDVTDSSAVDALFGQVEQQFGRLDLLFNNAGVNQPVLPLTDVTDDQWRAVVDTNLTGMFFCLRAAFRLMSRQTPRGGRIINNGSIAGQSPRPHSIAYAATKHAIAGLTKAASLEGRSHDIACGQIDIGNAATELSAGFAHGALQPDGRTIAEPSFDAAHVADAILYMAGLPLSANVPFMTVMATAMPLLGRG